MATIAKDRLATGSESERVSLLRNHHFFCELPRAIIERLAAYMKRRSAAKGSIIFEKGDPGIGLIGVLAGAVKISVGSLEGREVVLNIIREGEIFGEIALLDGRPRTADATAMTDCELFVIERRDFIPLMRRDSEFAMKLIEILCLLLRHQSRQAEDVMFLNLEIQDKSRQLAEASQHKSRFLANVSHELRTPLNAILGYTELIQDSVYGEPPEKMASVLDRISRNGKHLLGLINDVLDLSKIEAGQLVLALENYSLKDVVHGVYGAVET